ncbi:hypothetical protein RRG08_054641 [Elysia crispata]|uniref:Uncharacterized protein n=1 Tax=Elysia crispata TaxID=231223 RepID=A0AAE1B0W8_9GAST|nr:hypothetical protein RRG08_054641 [Elysia crispata]
MEAVYLSLQRSVGSPRLMFVQHGVENDSTEDFQLGETLIPLLTQPTLITACNFVARPVPQVGSVLAVLEASDSIVEIIMGRLSVPLHHPAWLCWKASGEAPSYRTLTVIPSWN